MNLRQIIIVVIGLVILVGSVALSGMLSKMKEPPKKEEPKEIRKYVKTQPVKYDEVQTNIVAFGRVRTAEMLDLIAEVSGRMTSGSKPLKEGQRFFKGDLLFKIDDTEARLQLQSKKSDFLRDLAAILPDMKIDFSDNYEAWERYFQSIELDKNLPELPNYKSSKEKTFIATKSIFSNYYSIKSDEANLRKHRYYAPFSGNISTVDLQSGSFVNPGNNIGKFIRSDKLELKVDVDSKDIEWVQLGGDVSITSEGGNQWNGVVNRIGEYVNPETQSIDVFIAIARGERRLYDGQYLTAEIPARKVENGMVIPRNSIFNGSEVYVLADSILKIREVNILRYNEETAIFDGLAEGEQVVVEPLINAHNNMKAYKSEVVTEKDIDLENKSARAKLVNN
ncbi:efflux RND transporter periplasmic adaptor subunit [Fulvivirga sp. M361]|uniref:efflux RND transporter periplasmic adaptor subunit n=1 Tax=Fulvivirga sp. M361 TaxID=2594266 RepID=UPI001179EC0D|nr:efflux RND transporter periplasmic adaptor subunit [Fulvivirga sp. M361]TRX59575.1 efflux RND transporter periplasmic adaptor subunit [Fulvivirga sp. M361]